MKRRQALPTVRGPELKRRPQAAGNPVQRVGAKPG